MPSKKTTKNPTLARLQARLDALGDKGTEQMKASLRSQIDALTGPSKGGGGASEDR